MPVLVCSAAMPVLVCSLCVPYPVVLGFLSVETTNSPSAGSPSLARDLFEGHGPAARADFEEVVLFSGGGSRWPEMAWTCRGRERPAGAGAMRAVQAGSRVWARG